jgi:hypothetical protein
MTFSPARKYTIVFGLALMLMPIGVGYASPRQDCARKADHSSRDYNVMNSVARGSSYGGSFSGITGSRSRSGTSLSGISRGIYGSSRNRTAYSATYQHCMSSFGG